MTQREHGRPSRETPLTQDVKCPTHAERARTLIQGCKTGSLATLTEDGFPYASYVTFGLTGGHPVFLISRLAEHTQNLMRDPKASLLIHETTAGDPLANGRVTVVGSCTLVTDDTSVRASFLETHPNAAYYVDFSDFSFYRLKPEGIRYIGGYGRMSWVDSEAWHVASPDPLLGGVEGIVSHMNEDHADALVLYAQAFTRAHEATEVTMTGVDRYGFELSVVTERGPRPARIAFEDEVTTSDEVRKTFISMLRDARALVSERASHR